MVNFSLEQRAVMVTYNTSDEGAFWCSLLLTAKISTTVILERSLFHYWRNRGRTQNNSLQHTSTANNKQNTET